MAVVESIPEDRCSAFRLGPGIGVKPAALIVRTQTRRAKPGPLPRRFRRRQQGPILLSPSLPIAENGAHQQSNHNIWRMILPDPISSGFAVRFPFPRV
jgi:hypothetical protein